MEKYKYHFLIVLFFIGILIGNIVNTFAKTDIDYYEEVIPIRNKLGDIVGEEVVITLPEGFNKEVFKINSSVFDGFYHYSSNDNEFIVKITVDNRSKYNYKYLDNSLIIKPKNSFDSNNYLNNVISDNVIISDSYYRSYNEAILNLVPVGSELSDDVLDFYLRVKGYDGINELNKYYDDYYGRWYSFHLLLEGDISQYKETNSVLVEDAYRYFYSKMMYYSCFGNKVAILKYKDSCCDIFSTFNKKSKTTMSDMRIYLDRNDYFLNYLVSVGFDFKLFRV